MSGFQKNITIEIAGRPLLLSLRYRKSAEYFEQFAVKASHPYAVPEVDDADWLSLYKNGFERSAQMESSFLSGKCSDTLLTTGCCLIHAAAFRDKKNAYLIAAEPGIGKSTQVKTLMDLYPGKYSVICGDRPALELTDDGTVMVHPTPWNGKENWGGAPAAPLSDLIFLKRGDRTSLRPLTKRESVLPTWESLIQTSIKEDCIRKAANFADQLLTRVNTWEFVNGGIPDSTEYLYQHLLRRE